MSAVLEIKGGKTRMHIFIMLVFFSLFYIIFPLYGEPSMIIYVCCLLGYILGTYNFFKIKKKTNYFDFDVFFILIYGLVSYSTTPFYPSETLYKALFVGYMFDVNYVNYGNILSTIGILAYYMGGSLPVKKVSEREHSIFINTRGMSLLLLILTVLFVAMGGRAYSQSAYKEGAGAYSSLIPYILLLLTYLSIVIITTELYNKKFFAHYSIDKYSIVSIAIVFLILLVGGSRSDASYIALPIIGIYTLVFKPMKMKAAVAFVMIAIVCMWLIGQVRTGDDVNGAASPILVLIDLTVPARNTYAVYEYVEANGFTFGSSFVGLFNTIPFLTGFLGLTEGSGELLTSDFLNNNPGYPTIGLATTVIADIYMAFGWVGVIVIMYFLGRFVNRSLIKASGMCYFPLIIYAALMSISVFIVRGNCTIPIRPVIWCLCISYVNYKIQLRCKR